MGLGVGECCNGNWNGKGKGTLVSRTRYPLSGRYRVVESRRGDGDGDGARATSRERAAARYRIVRRTFDSIRKSELRSGRAEPSPSRVGLGIGTRPARRRGAARRGAAAMYARRRYAPPSPPAAAIRAVRVGTMIAVLNGDYSHSRVN